jgi:hypothetical protein
MMLMTKRKPRGVKVIQSNQKCGGYLYNLQHRRTVAAIIIILSFSSAFLNCLFYRQLARPAKNNKMGQCMSGGDDPNRYQEVPRGKLIQYNLPLPPENGYSNFAKLIWCKDRKQEAKDAEQAEKEGKAPPTERDKKYYLCLGFFYEPYDRNEPPINLGKRKKGKPVQGTYKSLPRWDDPEYMEDIMRNGNFFQNDEFILKNYTPAIRPAEDYAYTEQYVKAYQFWNNGAKPTGDQIRAHKVHVLTTIMEELNRQENMDSKDEDTIQRLKDIIESMDPDDDHVREDCEQRLKEKKNAEQGGDGQKEEAKDNK